MATITGTVSKHTPLAAKRILILTATLESASDDIVLTLSTHGVRTIYGAWAVLTAGQDAEMLAGLSVSFSSLTITINSQAQAGTASTAWSDTTVTIFVIVD